MNCYKKFYINGEPQIVGFLYIFALILIFLPFKFFIDCLFYFEIADVYKNYYGINNFYKLQAIIILLISLRTLYILILFLKKEFDFITEHNYFFSTLIILKVLSCVMLNKIFSNYNQIFPLSYEINLLIKYIFLFILSFLYLSISDLAKETISTQRIVHYA